MTPPYIQRKVVSEAWTDLDFPTYEYVHFSLKMYLKKSCSNSTKTSFQIAQMGTVSKLDP